MPESVASEPAAATRIPLGMVPPLADAVMADPPAGAIDPVDAAEADLLEPVVGAGVPADGGPIEPAADDAPADAHPRPVRVLSYDIKSVAIPLTEEEFAAKAHRLATLQDDIVAEEARQATIKKDLKNAMARLEGERAEIALVVRDRQEVRQVRVRVEADYDGGTVRSIVDATGQCVSTRPLREDEYQMPLADAPRPADDATDDFGDGLDHGVDEDEDVGDDDSE